MELEERLQNEIDRIINTYKTKCSDAGRPVTDSEEYFMRIGIQYGYLVASQALCFLPADEKIGRNF